jgi:hypothetical protein
MFFTYKNIIHSLRIAQLSWQIMVNCLRDKTIKIHVVIHNQLKAPIHNNMTRNAWYAAKLVTSSKVFNSVNQEAFRKKVKTTKLECSKCSRNVAGVTKFSAFIAHKTGTLPNTARLSP